ncbi:MAG: alpha/beta hydrolase [Proteobacteria bacterium]|nr:alpha/beta hydrolase [Pseudomonadota bacterium]MDA1331741.1 alpha/beta hydrolase [Pseudomonadota bacterium]
MRITNSVFDIDDKRLEYRCIEPNNSTSTTDALVMLHEGLGSIELWKSFPEDLAKATGCRVFVYSRYGYGRSTPLSEKRPVEYMHYEALNILPNFLKHIGVVCPILIGHSDGASIALIHNGGGHDVNGLVLMAPHVFVEDRAVQSIEQARVAFEKTELPKKLDRYHDNVESAFWGWNDVWLSSEFKSWNIEKYVANVSCESLLIQSDTDPYGTLAQIEIIEKLSPAPTQRVLLEDCGHSPHVDQPRITLENIVHFVEDILNEAKDE